MLKEPWDNETISWGRGLNFLLLIWHNISIEIRGIYIKMLRDHEQTHGHHMVILVLLVGAGSISGRLPLGCALSCWFTLHSKWHWLVCSTLSYIYFCPDVNFRLPYERRIEINYQWFLIVVSFWERAPWTHSTFVCHRVEMVFVRLGGEGEEQRNRDYGWEAASGWVGVLQRSQIKKVLGVAFHIGKGTGVLHKHGGDQRPLTRPQMLLAWVA